MPANPWVEPSDFDSRRRTFVRDAHDAWKPLDGTADDDEVLLHICHRENEMRFRLVYDGPLGSGDSGNKTDNKWRVRNYFHPQLEELWKFKPVLQGYATAYPNLSIPEKEGDDITLDGAPTNVRVARNFQRLRHPIERNGARFLPLVRSDLFLTCTIDILFLRQDGPGSSFTHAGDLDNRIKTFFDGLKMPEKNEPTQQDLANPFYCLLEDDKLITSFAIRTDRLLHRLNEPKDAVVLVADVVVVPTRIKMEINSGFEWD